MPRRLIWSDSLTLKEIDGALYRTDVTVSFTPLDNDGEPVKGSEPKTITAVWDSGENMVDAMTDLVEGSDLAAFIIRTRSLVSLAADPEVVRKWAQSTHPELKVPDRGRLPADVYALYRREVGRPTANESAAK